MSTFENDIEIFQDEKTDTNSKAPFDEYTLFEIEHDRQLGVIYNFKCNISKEAEFCGIYSLSSYVILRAFSDSEYIPVNTKLKNVLTNEQLAMFKSVYFEIYNTRPNEIYLYKIARNISNKIYV
jgi:hypothetical protein